MDGCIHVCVYVDYVMCVCGCIHNYVSVVCVCVDAYICVRVDACM